MKDIVKLRKRTSAKTGVVSLFLDWVDAGERRYEYLGLYLNPGKDPLTKAKNKQTMETARTLQAKKIVEVQQGLAGIKKEVSTKFTDYMDTYISSHSKEGTSYYKGLMSARIQWTDLFGESKTIQSIKKEDMIKFSVYLKKSMGSESSAYAYYNKISTILTRAVNDGLIDKNPAKSLDRTEKPSNLETEREYLTMDEVKILAASPCKNADLKAAFLFSCYTGLRYIDIEQLTWDMIQGDYVVKRIEKTEDMAYIPLSETAMSLLPPRSGGSVFHLKSYRQMRRDLNEWIQWSGIKKKITFHCARHTFATLSLTYGADLYTVSSLLGHKNISTTQIYAKVVDEKKQKAVSLIPKI